MSYILDALRKSELERQDTANPMSRVIETVETPSRRPVWPWVLAMALVVNAAVIAFVMWPSGDIAEPATAKTSSPASLLPPPEPAPVIVAEAEPSPATPVEVNEPTPPPPPRTEEATAPVVKTPVPAIARNPEPTVETAPSTVEAPTPAASKEAPVPAAPAVTEEPGDSAPVEEISSPTPPPMPAPVEVAEPSITLPEPPKKAPVLGYFPPTKPALPAARPETAIVSVKRMPPSVDKALFDREIKNYTQAIRRNRNYADAYFGRGWAYERKGLSGKAIADYDKAIRINPDFAMAFINRGVLRFYNNQADKAAEDFASAHAKAGDVLRRYTLLWLYLSRQNKRDDAKAILAAKSEGVDMAPWPGIIASMYLGDATPEQVLAAAGDNANGKQREKEIVAYFFVAKYYLLNGNEEKSATLFWKSLDTGVTDYRQYWDARRELKRMGLLK